MKYLLLICMIMFTGCQTARISFVNEARHACGKAGIQEFKQGVEELGNDLTFKCRDK